MPELPYEIWKDRIENELTNIKKLKVLEENTVLKGESSVEFTININALGLIKNKGELIPQRSHRIFLKINRSFPYPGGIDFSWITHIFHPNIHPVQIPQGNPGTGYICLNVLKKWSRLSDLETTAKALKNLVENPNPDDPLNYPICLEAAELFRNKTMSEIKEGLNIAEEQIEEKEEEEEDVLIIDD
ncbi:MAG: ubiquitin-conjugating enzyme E2 [Promethearchaeota archaeon]